MKALLAPSAHSKVQNGGHLFQSLVLVLAFRKRDERKSSDSCQDSNPPTPYLGRRIVPKKHAFVHLGIALTLFESLLNGSLLHFSVNNDLSIYVDVVDGDFNAFKSDEIIHLTFD